jgi:flagellar hook-length control protein FliK
MSTASALLSMIAPAAPATPQGSTAVDASAFEGLLNAVVAPAAEGENGSEAAPIVDVSLADDAAGIEVAVSVPGLPAAVQPLLQITGAALSTLVSEAVHAPITVALNTRPVEAEAVEAETTPDLAPEAPAAAPAPVLTNPSRDLAPAPAEDAERVDAEASPVLDVAPLVQPALPAPAAEIAVKASVAPPTDGKRAESPTETGPQVRPQVKAEPVDDALVQPLAPVDTTAKAAPAEPLVRPAEPVAEDLTREPASTDAVRTSRPTVTDPQVQQTAATAPDVVAPVQPEPVVAPLTPAPTPDAATKATTSAPLTQPPVAPEAATKSAPVADSRPQTQPPVPVEVVADAAAKGAVAEPLTRPQEPVVPDAVTPAVTKTDGKPVETPRAAETPNLRALAERASRPVDSNAAVDTAAPAATTTNTASAEPVAQTAAAPSATPQTPAAVEAAVSPEVAAGDDAADLPVEAAAPEAAPSAQVAQSAREALSPTLSRTAIEATAQIAAQILKKLDGRTTRFEMSLTPDELGRVDIKLDIDTEGRLAARLAFDNPAAATDLKGRVDELRRQLEQQGFQLSEDAFEFTQRDSGSSAFDRGQDTRQGQSRAFAAAARLNTEADAVAQPPRWQALSLAPTGVDMKV